MSQPSRLRSTILSFAIAGTACTDRVDDFPHCAPIRGPVGAASDLATLGDAGTAPWQSDVDSPTVAVESDAYVSGVNIAVHERVKTILLVSWTQTLVADRVWLEFGFGDGEVLRSRAQSGAAGTQRAVALGIPAETAVWLRVVSEVGDDAYASRAYEATTGALPSGLPRPEVFRFDSERASHERWLFGSVEDSIGGSYTGYYYSTFWLYILDRKGRIVWYYADPSTNATSSFQRVARDGEYIWIEKRAYSGSLDPSVVKTTLDGEYFEEVSVPGLSDCIDVTDDGSLLYDRHGDLHELSRNGADRAIWSCGAHFGSGFECYTNTVNWYPEADSVLLSFPYENTVVEIDRSSGQLEGQYGRVSGSYGFAPPQSQPPEAWGFSFQHFPNRTPQGTLLVSSHVPSCGEDSQPGPNQHAFVEFEIDREQRQLVERWRYTGGREWPRAKGMAIRVSNGNTLGNYGTGGVIREVDPEGRTVFGVKFDVPEGDDFYNKMVGHNVLLDDLYALNGGPR
jgi:hypothetical protein